MKPSPPSNRRRKTLPSTSNQGRSSTPGSSNRSSSQASGGTVSRSSVDPPVNAGATNSANASAATESPPSNTPYRCHNQRAPENSASEFDNASSTHERELGNAAVQDVKGAVGGETASPRTTNERQDIRSASASASSFVSAQGLDFDRPPSRPENDEYRGYNQPPLLDEAEGAEYQYDELDRDGTPMYLEHTPPRQPPILEAHNFISDSGLDDDVTMALARRVSNPPSRRSTIDEDEEKEKGIFPPAGPSLEFPALPLAPIPGPSAFNAPQHNHTGGNNNNHFQLQNAAAVARSHAVGPGIAPGLGFPNHFQANYPGGGLVHNWQATKHSLKERFSFMFCNEILADVHFVVGRGDQRQRIPAHKFVLSVGSAVFDAMFNGAMASQSGEDNDIELPDVEPAAFLALLKFLYSDDVQIGPESVMTTLYTAKKYAVPALENSCVDFLKRNLNADNAFMLLTQARLFDEPQLAALCLEMIDKQTAEALSAEGFTDIDLETLCAVLERDTLRIREAVLYQAVVRWSVEECHRQQLPTTSENQRQLLGRALSLIRFPLMTVEEFAQSAAQSGILSDREIVNLFLYFTVNPKPTVGFLDVPRCCVTGKEQVVNRFQRIEGRWGYSGTPDRIKFNVDRRIFVVGFGLYGSIHGPTEYQVTIQIIHCGTGKVLGSNETSFSCDGSSSTFRVLFKEPVEISPCVTYIASACLKGPDSHYGTKGLRRIVHQSPGSGCVTFQFTYAAGNNNGTSVEDGQVPEIIFYTKIS